MEKVLTSHHLILVKKTGAGIRIEGAEAQRARARSAITSSSLGGPHMPDPEKRIVAIGLRLCSRNRTRVRELSDLLYASRATIGNDLGELSKRLPAYRLSLDRRGTGGISLSGSEKNVRDLLFALLVKSEGYGLFKSIVENEGTRLTGALVFPDLSLVDYQVAEIARLIRDSDQGGAFAAMPSDSFLAVLMRAIIAAFRAKAGHPIVLSPEFVTELSDLHYFNEAGLALDSACQTLGIASPELEKRYLQVFLLALHGMDAEDSDTGEAESVASALIAQWGDLLGIDLEQDEELLVGLAGHLSSAIVRFKHGIRMANPMLGDTRRLYPNTLEVVKGSLKDIEQSHGWVVSEDEAAFLALHLAAALERRKEPVRALLVAREGIGAQELLSQKLGREVPEISVCGHLPPSDFETSSLDGYDVVLTTLDMDAAECSLPVILVSPLMEEGGYARVRTLARNLYKQKNDPATHISLKMRQRHNSSSE